MNNPWHSLRRFYFNYLHYNDRRAIWLAIKKVFGLTPKKTSNSLPYSPGETSKAEPRRTKEGFFEKYCQGKGLDIGYGGDLLSKNCQGWDFADGNAQYLKGLPDETYDFVYASHVLEHMRDPAVALKNWWRVLKVGGYLIIAVPDRDLFEQRKRLPSYRNNDHKHFFSLDKDEAPDTLGLRPLIERNLPNAKTIYAKICSNENEYSIEAIVKKDA